MRRFDRKASAVAEFTMKQYSKRISTWVIFGVGMLAVSIIMLFYFDTISDGIESRDNDGDSIDYDGDSYPTGQELIYGTDPFNPESHPGKIDPSILPDDPSKYIDEDDFDWDSLAESSSGVGYDDDGDGTIEAGETLRLRSYCSGGTFQTDQEVMYIQDSWDVTDRLNLNIGISTNRCSFFF